MILQDKVCFITGSTRGIGWATAREFARHGATVILNHRGSATLLEERCGELEAEFHGTTMGLAADVNDAPAVKNCYAEIFRRFKRMDVLVNNAGVLQDALLGMISHEMMRAVIDTNLFGSLVHLQEAARLMARNRRGSIINVSSIIGRYGNEGQTVYAASKAAVIGMTMAAAKELAPKNIRVNAVAPRVYRYGDDTPTAAGKVPATHGRHPHGPDRYGGRSGAGDRLLSERHVFLRYRPGDWRRRRDDHLNDLFDQ